MTDGLSSLTTPLTGKVALVTGGAIRVGRVICRALASRGADIAFTYLPGEPAEEACAEIAAADARGLARPRPFWRCRWMYESPVRRSRWSSR